MRADLGEIFRVDAKAEGKLICVGGWSTGPSPEVSRARWFSEVLSPEVADWAFVKEDQPRRVVASLELLAVLFGVALLGPAASSGGMSGTCTFTAGTDNQGNAKLFLRQSTTKYPLCVLLMELASRLNEAGWEMRLAWRRRDTNVEADRLTNGNFEGFRAENRIRMPFPLPFPRMLALLEAGSEFYGELLLRRQAVSAKRTALGAGRLRRSSLRLSDPW